jgi:hypothetical protein
MLWPGALLGTAAAVAAAFIGASIGDVLAGDRSRLGRPILAGAGVALLVALLLPLPRSDATVHARLTTEPAGADRARVEIALDTRDAASGADWFEVMSWQGGAVEVHPLQEFEPGRYRIAGSVPVTGEWKTVVRLAKQDTIIGTGVYLPADPEIGAREIPLERSRDVELVRDTEFLLRESKSGPAWPALVAWSAIVFLAATWIGALAFAYSSVAPADRSERVTTAEPVAA